MSFRRIVTCFLCISCPWSCCPVSSTVLCPLPSAHSPRCSDAAAAATANAAVDTRHRHHKKDVARLLHATACASAFRVMTALLLCRVRVNDEICACTAIAGFSLQKENKNVTRSSDSLSIKQTHLHASMHKHTQTRTQMLVSSLQ